MIRLVLILQRLEAADEFCYGVFPADPFPFVFTALPNTSKGSLQAVGVIQNLERRLSSWAGFALIHGVCRVAFDLDDATVHHPCQDPTPRRADATDGRRPLALPQGSHPGWRRLILSQSI
jgi:hypothetical protein